MHYSQKLGQKLTHKLSCFSIKSVAHNSNFHYTEFRLRLKLESRDTENSIASRKDFAARTTRGKAPRKKIFPSNAIAEQKQVFCVNILVTIMAKKLTENGQNMDKIWTKNGKRMDLKCISNVQKNLKIGLDLDLFVLWIRIKWIWNGPFFNKKLI